jgi:hypothetical protein
VEACQRKLTGMSEAIDLATAAGHRDPEVGLAAVAALRQLLEQLEALQVKAAREDGWTWERIATALGVTRQSVHRKYAGRRLPGRRRS